MRRRWSLRTLLIALYLGSVLPLLLGLGLALHLEYRAFLIAEHHATLKELVDVIVAPRSGVASASPTRLAGLLDAQLRDTDFEAVLLDAAGQPLSAGDRRPLLSATEHAGLRAGAVPISREVARETGVQMVYARAIPADGGGALGTVEGRFAVAAVDPELERLTGWLAITVAVAVACVIGLAPLVARLAVHPLRGLVATARAVGKGRLDARATPSAVYEPRELALTVNAMLDQLQTTLDAETRTAVTMRRFAADASHELRSPLAVFGSGLELIAEALRQGDDAQVQDALTRMRREHETMRRLVEDLLLLARMDRPTSSASPLRCEPVEPLPLLEAVAERARLLAAGQLLRLTWPDQLPPTLDADPEALTRALNNLVENALRHTPPGRAVTLSVVPDGAACRFRVADEGEGIAAEHLPHLGQRFYRVDAARGRAGGGTGLGLAIVRAIAEAHGGRLELASAPGAGTTAHLIIPARSPSQMPRQAQALAALREADAVPGRPGFHPRLRLAALALALSVGVAVPVALSGALGTAQGRAVEAPEDARQAAMAQPSAVPSPATARVEPSGNLLPRATPTVTPTTATDMQPRATPLDTAAAIATAQLGGLALSVAYKDEASGLLVEVSLSDGRRAVVDLRRRAIRDVEQASQGRGRGVERQRLERAALASAVVSSARLIGFDAAVAGVRLAEGVRDVGLTLSHGQLIYEVRLRDDTLVLVDPQSGEVVRRLGVGEEP